MALQGSEFSGPRRSVALHVYDLSFRVCGGDRQREGKRAALARFARHRDPTAVQLHKLAAEIKSQSHPLSAGRVAGFDLIKAIEDAVVFPGGNAATGVADRHLDKSRLRGGARVDFDPPAFRRE